MSHWILNLKLWKIVRELPNFAKKSESIYCYCEYVQKSAQSAIPHPPADPTAFKCCLWRLAWSELNNHSNSYTYIESIHFLRSILFSYKSYGFHHRVWERSKAWTHKIPFPNLFWSNSLSLLGDIALTSERFSSLEIQINYDFLIIRFH